MSLRTNPLTGIWSAHLGLQLLDLFNQQGDVLQQVFVLQQQLVDTSLGLQSGRGLGAQLVLQEVHLEEERERDGQVEEKKTGRERETWSAVIHVNPQNK